MGSDNNTMDNYTAQESFAEERAYYLNKKDIKRQAKLELLDEMEKPCPHEPYKFLEVKRCDCYICLEEIRKEITDVP